MALAPEDQVPESVESDVPPSKTYSINFETGDISRKKIDGLEAIKQFALKAIQTPRFKHWIYSNEFGCEVMDLIGRGFTKAFMESEMERMIEDALIYDERIEQIENFDGAIREDKLEVSFIVKTVEGFLEVSEVI
jgi:phage baseplate assembly protein W